MPPEEKKKDEGNPMQDALIILGGLAVLVALWYYVGGPGKADLGGLFLAPPQPLGTGESYGPGGETPTQESNTQNPEAQGYYLNQ